ncbi:uncharacterized protein GGS22DRAFT_149657 [Annulohypoxylon maeteangense]|uniref:uncharacterized protein n=1 Tax=Annulohypoxylon maeteangense TaxID=1927788 RepID=UPI0020086BE5|nr:uncharacterized protein GGS22DRAFT_149657 [Annulohypoxylon maeteangense]KAI0889977.1 hypothetical protein GGS22DRAFT_149657 [Annulohypoxylon maeteangense]
MEQQPEVEILVHIGAPSRAVDDTRYRSLTTSYLEFQPVRRVEVFSQASSRLGRNDEIKKDQGNLQDLLRDISTTQPSSEPFGTLKSPQASFQSVLDNAGSPRVPKRCIPEDESASAAEGLTMPMTQSSWQSPSSIVQDSFSENHIDISNFTSPTRVLEHYLQRFDSPSTGPTASQRSVNSISRGSTSRNSDHPRSVARHLAPLVPCTPSVVPCTPPGDSLSPVGGLSRRAYAMEHHKGSVQQNQQQNSQSQDEITSDDIIEETIMESSPDLRSLVRADSEPVPNKQYKPSLSPRALLRAASDIGPRPSSHQRSSVLTVSFLRDHGYTYDSLELRAPDPSISMMEVGSDNFITPGLERLAQDLNIPKRYRPKEMKRDLRPFERGYWLVDCSAWDSQLKRDAWAYLANYIGTGVAGWGIWCRRDVDFRSLRVYCWGLVTAHVYLLLYLASQRKILYTGSSWVDSEGIPVVVMETRD